MFKFGVIAVLTLAVCIAADPIRQKPLRRRVSARQQVQPTPAPTGYPLAGVTPEIPFELPTETEKTDIVYGPPEIDTLQPDEVNSTPEDNIQQPDDVYGPPETVGQEPDEVYGPPEFQTVQPHGVYGAPENEAIPEIVENVAQEDEEAEEEVKEVAEDLDEEGEKDVVDENDVVISVSSTFAKPERLIYQRFPQRRQPPNAVPALLTREKIIKPANFVYRARF